MLWGSNVDQAANSWRMLGFAGAFWRSELVALDVADLETGTEGLTVQAGAPRKPVSRAGGSQRGSHSRSLPEGRG